MKAEVKGIVSNFHLKARLKRSKRKEGVGRGERGPALGGGMTGEPVAEFLR